MISIEYALDQYTDLINENQRIDLEIFKKELLPTEYNEFIREVEYINKIKSYGIAKSFKRLFNKINEYKETVYAMDMVVDFRGKNTNDKTIKMIDDIFNEEFKDE